MSGRAWMFLPFRTGDGRDFDLQRRHLNACRFLRLKWSRYEELSVEQTAVDQPTVMQKLAKDGNRRRVRTRRGLYLKLAKA